MRIPVYARGANPAIDPPIVRKSISYASTQVSDGLAYWVNPSDTSKGIIAREMLPRPEPIFAPEPLNPALPAAELPGVIFEDPELSQKTKAERARLMKVARMICHFRPEKETVEVHPER